MFHLSPYFKCFSSEGKLNPFLERNADVMVWLGLGMAGV